MKFKMGELINGPLIGINTYFYTSLCLSSCDINKEDKILNVGCGSGHLEYLLSNKVLKATGIDISEDMLFNLNNDPTKPQNVEFICLDATNECPIEFLNSFDKIFCMDVMEHVEKNPELLQFIYKSLNKGGTAVLTFPVNNWNHGCSLFTPERVYNLLEQSPLTVNKVRFIKYGRRAAISRYIYENTVKFGQKSKILPSSNRTDEVPLEKSMCFSIKQKKWDTGFIFRIVKFVLAILGKFSENSYTEIEPVERVLIYAQKIL